MRRIPILILIYLLLQWPSEIFASVNVGQSIKRISPDGGFTLAPVMEISQDHLGFIWFITREKLYQYNSQDFIIYNPQFPTNISQANNNISSLLIDQSNRIWVGTNVGLNIFSDTNEQLNFVALRDQENADRLFNIIDIKQNCNGEIWLLDGSNLARLDTATMEVEYVKFNRSRLSVNAFCFDKAGNVYAANNQGEMFHIQSATLQADQMPFDMSPVKLHGMYLIDNVMWITTDGYGFSRYSMAGKLLGSYPDKASTSAFTFSNRVREVTQTSDGKIWIATYKGMLQWDENIIMQVINNDDGANSLPDNSVVALFEDNQKGLWIGTWRGGLAYLNPYSNTFKTYSHSNFQNSVANNLINVIAEDKEGNIWIGTDGNGMDVFNEKKNLFTHIHLEGESQTNTYNVKSILCEPDGDIWVGTFREGIFYRKNGERDFSRRLLKNENVYDLVSDENGLWIATFSSGLYYFRFDDKSLKQYTYNQNDPASLPSNHLRKLLFDKDKNLWIISNAGVTIKPFGKNTFERLLIERMNKSGTIQIYSIISDKEGKIWLGTDNGMLSIDNQTRDIKSHPLLFNGKPVSVYGMVSLQEDQMWISSNFGIFSYNITSESYLNYSTIDGLPGNLFNAGALCFTSSERIWLGGTTGLVVFNPKNMQVNPYIPKVYFSKIFINHKEVLTNQLNSPLKKPLYKTERLKLKPAQNSFSIEFVALNYLNSQKNQFKYRLKGFDRDWVESGYNARATYTNIPPGKYVFEVLSCNNDMVWGEDPGRLEIVIPPPFLLSRVAIIFYVLLSVFLILLARRVMLNREKLKGQIELERVYRQQEEKTHQEKLTFFTNISHELRTPLTLISGPVDELLNSDGIDQVKYNYLTLIKRNSDRLLKLINQLLDFRRIENQKMDLLVYETDMVPFVHNIFEYFQDTARQRGINYLFVSLAEKFPATFDGDKLDKAIFNLLSNAFKFTPEKGTVQVELIIDRKSRTTPTNSKSNVYCDGVLVGDQFIQISVEDNGEGIAEQHLRKIFDRFYRGSGSEPSQSGTGIGLNLTRNLIIMHGGEIEVESVLGKGSVFRLRIPCDKNYLQKLHEQSGIEIHQLSNPSGDEKIISGKQDEISLLSENWPPTERGQNSHEKLILVVEDNQDLKNFIQHVLTDLYCIITCNNGSEGVEKARLFLPDLIISDIVMPEKSGIEMLKELKADISTSHIPIILLTALTTDENKIEGYTLGADDYIEKPFNSEVLKARLKNMFDSRAALQQFYVGKISQGFEGDKADSPDQKLLLKALRFVEKNMTDENLGIDLLASHLNLSRSTLHRKLKALTNKSASDFIRTIRLEYAARMLREGHENIDEISVMSGFNSHSYFTRSFKEHFNKTPTEFIQLHKETK